MFLYLFLMISTAWGSDCESGFVSTAERVAEAEARGTGLAAIKAPVGREDLPESPNLEPELVEQLVNTYRNQGEAALRNQIDDWKENRFPYTPPLDKEFMKVYDKIIRDQFLDMVAEQVGREKAREAWDRGKAENDAKNAQNGKIHAELDQLAQEIIGDSKYQAVVVQPSSVDQFLLSQISESLPGEAFLPLEKRVIAVFDSAVRELDNEFEFFGQFRDSEGREPTFTELFTEALGEESSRRRLVNLALTVARRRSQALLDEGAHKRVDVLFIGAGLHEQNMQNYLAHNVPNLTTLTLEKTDQIASTFASGGKSFNLNSSSKPVNEDSLRQVLGEDDLNFLPGGTAQVRQYAAERNPPAEAFADAITLNRSLNIDRNPILFGQAVVRVEQVIDEKTGQTIFETTTADGRVFESSAVIQMGIGEPTAPPIPSLKEEIANLQEQPLVEEGQPRRILFYPDWVKFTNSVRKPLSPFAGKKVGVVGPGDSGKAVVRWLSRNANPQSYRRDTADVGLPEQILWFGQPCNDCTEFVGENRSFYADLSGPFKSGLIKPKNRMVAFEALSDGRFRIESQETDDQGLPSRSEGEIVDFLILTTGFSNPIDQIYGTIVGEKPDTQSVSQFIEESPQFRVVKGFEPSLGVVGFARQLINQDGQPVDAYFVGPLAGGIVDEKRELKNIEENSVANTNHNWRAWRFMEALSLRIQEGKKKSLPDRQGSSSD